MDTRILNIGQLDIAAIVNIKSLPRLRGTKRGQTNT